MAITNYNKETETKFAQLLETAVSQPGTMMKAYSNFWNYSLGNQMLALFQASARGMQVGPIASFNRWKELGRFVKKGEKAIELCMPITMKRTTEENGEEKEITFSRFVFRRNWFMLSQTDGVEYQAPAVPAWDYAQALVKLNVTETRFEMMNGNCQGYAQGRTIAINPLAQHPNKTRFHELAHIELGHTTETAHDTENLPRNLKEVEAESVALLCLESLGIDGAEFCRGYIQGWLKDSVIPEKSAQKIFAAADRILKAGTEKKDNEKE